MAMYLFDGQALPVDPSEVSFGYMDISDSDAGRDNVTGKMYKGKKGTCRQFKFVWSKNLTPANTAAILTAIKKEYIDLTFPDPQTNSTLTREFYGGDRTGAIRAWTTKYKRYTQISVTLTERTPV